MNLELRKRLVKCSCGAYCYTDVKHRLWEGEKEKWREALTRAKRERTLKNSSKEEVKLVRTYYRRKRNINYIFEDTVKRIKIRGRV